ncbi:MULTISPECIES: LacI family DNA-binding transcriptional regulator [unclassified Luteococcus]|uniref:LacI family DNA-binding transcriptional regulator n=1 Tax=unclassified Luteococcus TaxID=2639923 RepID=UPI00313BBAF5
MKRATITDVAAHAGVSRTTVSLVLRDADRIPAATKAKVRASMDELGYVYNRAGAAVRAGQSSLLGLLLTDIRNPFFAEVTMAVDRAVAAQGMSVLQSFSFGDPEHEARSARSLAEQFLGGLILLPTAEATAERLHFLAAAQPLVQLLREVPGLDCDFVGVDNRESGRLLGIHLARQGLRRVVLVGGTQSAQLADRRSGLSEGLGGPVQLALGGVGGLTTDQSAQADCLVTYNDTHLLSALGALRAAGRTPGVDVAVASFDDTAIAASTHPTVTSVDHHVAQLAEQAVRLVLARSAEPHRPLERILVPPTLVVRDSTCLRR